MVAMFVVYPRVATAQQVSREVANLGTLQAGIRSTLATQGGVYTALGTMGSGKGEAFVNQARIVPAAMNGGNYSTTDLKNTWGGAVLIHSTTGVYVGHAAGRMFVIRYNNVPRAACVDLVSSTVGKFDAMWVNGSSGMTYLTPENFTVEKAINRCGLQDPVVFMSH